MSTLCLNLVVTGFVLLVALPGLAQDAGGPEGAPDAAPEAAQQAPEEDDAAGGPETGGEEPAGEAAAAGEAAEDPAAGENAEETAENPADGPVVVEVEEGGVLDDQTFEGEDDDFIPSEEIPVDQPIPFPTDI